MAQQECLNSLHSTYIAPYLSFSLLHFQGKLKEANKKSYNCATEGCFVFLLFNQMTQIVPMRKTTNTYNRLLRNKHFIYIMLIYSSFFFKPLFLSPYEMEYQIDQVYWGKLGNRYQIAKFTSKLSI